jgi:hypothetical protein
MRSKVDADRQRERCALRTRIGAINGLGGLGSGGFGTARRIPSRTALNLAWGGHDGYCVARNRVYPGNVGLHKLLNGPRFRSAARHQRDIRAKCPQFGGKDATIFGVDFDGAERLRIQCFLG